MAHLSLDWDNAEKTILRLTIYNGWTWEDAFEMNPVGLRLLRDADHTVHVLVDFTNTRDLPTGATMHMPTILNSYPPNLGLVIAVTQHTLVNRMINVLRAVFPGKLSEKFQVVDSFEDAYARFADYSDTAG